MRRRQGSALQGDGALSPLCRTRAALALLTAGLAGCAGAPSPTAVADARLFAHGMTDIRELYIRPVSNRDLVVAGAARLATLDPALGAAAGPGAGSQSSLVVSYDRHTIGSFWMPDDSDTTALADTLAGAIALARRASPRLDKMPEDAIDKAVFDGMTATLDRFSRYSPPDVAREARESRNGFGRIGVTLDTSNDDFRITALVPNSPAEHAGIRPGDRIIEINGVATAGHTRAEVTHMLRGPEHAPITVAVARGQPPERREFRMQRAILARPAVTMTEAGNVAVFRVAIFNRTTTEKLAEGLAAAEHRPGRRLAGVVLDLRGNPGGLLEEAVSLAELFVADGPIVSTTGRHPASRQRFAASGHALAPRVPIVVLVDAGSASAAEIVAAALQDLGRAVVVGTPSYGKGTVQTVMRLPNDGELILTWARLIAPSGYLLQGHGVVPSVCTSDGVLTLETALQRARAAPGLAGEPRAELDEAGWQELRRACPPRHGNPGVDLQVAERLLADPALYAAALRPPARTSLVRAGPDEPSLTGPRGALSSGRHRN
jgi:carboxyl-terminal processing protease